MKAIKNRAMSKSTFVIMSVLILMFAAMTVSVLAAPTFNVPMTVEQPDGNGMLVASGCVVVNCGNLYDVNNFARMVQPISSHGNILAKFTFYGNGGALHTSTPGLYWALNTFSVDLAQWNNTPIGQIPSFWSQLGLPFLRPHNNVWEVYPNVRWLEYATGFVFTSEEVGELITGEFLWSENNWERKFIAIWEAPAFVGYLTFYANGGYIRTWTTGIYLLYNRFSVDLDKWYNSALGLDPNFIYQIGIPIRDNYEFVGWREYDTGILYTSEELGWNHGGALLWHGNNWENKFTAIWEPMPQQGNSPCPTTNLAHNTQGVTMTASSYVPARPARMANNGVREGAATQSWAATGINQEWLQVDFGEVRNFNHIRIFQGGNRIMDYSFQYSNDGVTWNTFHYGFRIMQATPIYYEFTHSTTIQARYVRLFSQRSSGVQPIVVFEFEVFYMPTS